MSCKCTANKIPQLVIRLQRKRDGGLIPQGIGWGVSQTPEPIGCDQMLMGNPMNPQIPFSLVSPIINFFQKLVEAVNALGKVGHGGLMA